MMLPIIATILDRSKPFENTNAITVSIGTIIKRDKISILQI